VAGTLCCENCGATLVVGDTRTITCPYCASPHVVERPASRDRPDPRFVLTFTGGDDRPRAALRDWIGRQSLFADGALRRARVEDLRGVYVPAGLYSAIARSTYSAEIGEDYTTTETYTTTDSEGNSHTETRTVTHTEWRPLAGHHTGYVTDVIVSASKGLPNAELERVEPFDLRQLRRYEPALISGWITEEPSRTIEECATLARGEAGDRVLDALAKFMPGDSYRGLRSSTTVEWETMDPVLVPIWVLAVRYRLDRPALRVVVNGQTGKATGKAPLSPVRIGIAVMLAVLAITAIIAMAAAGHR
jgi:hypothetical protein